MKLCLNCTNIKVSSAVSSLETIPKMVVDGDQLGAAAMVDDDQLEMAAAPTLKSWIIGKHYSLHI